ncbi:MAG TPA: tRNA 2-selenouridine(34) synthase MnmH [Quisquiliibacterium sp.]|nr:tRNA 2-selenouridine(34) synthase MnmH [Quisquiliibacterium sp.]
MKEPELLPIDAAIERIDRFDAIIDARSPSEFAEDHLPGARSMPVLDDAQRARVGTLYKQQGAFEAKRIGAALVSRNIADLIDGPLADAPRHWQALVYCWRGGNRSGALATVLARIGWRISLIEGGYRAFRRRVVDDLAQWPARHRFTVLAGRTGSGKSLLLEELARQGAQVLDLEQLAQHRGSVLGHLPHAPGQPSQKRFETLLWDRLRRFDPARPILVESESRKIGQCQVPEALILAMRASPCVVVEASDAVRSTLLLREYRHFVEDPERLRERLQALHALHGAERIAGWMSLARAGDWDTFVRTLLHEHYDPAYDRSMKRNYARLEQAHHVSLEGIDDAGLADAARRVLALTH